MLKFISFLGTNKYETCNYYLNDIKIANCDYIQEALIRMLIQQGKRPDKVIVFTTRKAFEINWVKNNRDVNQPGLEKTLKNIPSLSDDIVKNVFIPDGNNEEELWALFSTVMDEIEEGDEIIFDVTHSFRFLPMLAFIVLNYARIVKKCTLDSIYYGAFDVLGSLEQVKNMPIEHRDAPVFDLTPFVEIFDWTLGIDRYLNTGDVSVVTQLTERELKDINRRISQISKGDGQDPYKKSKILKKLAKAMQHFSDVVFACRGQELTEAALALKDAINDAIANDAYKDVKPFLPIMGMLQKRFNRFEYDDFKVVLETAKWCLDNKMYQQGLTILEEGIISYICDKCGMDKTKLDDRELISYYMKMLHTQELCPDQISDRVDPMLISKLMALLYNIAYVRNDINRAGWRSNSMKTTGFRKCLEEFLERVESIVEPSASTADSTLCYDGYIGRPCEQGKRMLLIFSHELTPAQEKEAREKWGVSEFIPLPAELASKWSNVPPMLKDLSDYLSDIFEWIDANTDCGDLALVQGDYGATLMVVEYCLANGLKPIYATTERVVKEGKEGDRVVTSREFQHVMFREYRRW